MPSSTPPVANEREHAERGAEDERRVGRGRARPLTVNITHRHGQARPKAAFAAAKTSADAEGEQARASSPCRRPEAGANSFAEQFVRREHQPVEQDRLVGPQLVIELRDDPVAGFEHLAGTLGVLRLVFVPEVRRAFRLPPYNCRDRTKKSRPFVGIYAILPATSETAFASSSGPLLMPLISS